MAKKSSESMSKVQKASGVSLEQVQEDLKVASGKLLETAGVMHSFTQSLNNSGFQEYVDYLGRPWRAFWFNFAVGIARGLGFVIGATVVVAVVVWVISQVLTQLPVVGAFFETLRDFLSDESLRDLQSANAGETLSRMFEAFKTNILQAR